MHEKVDSSQQKRWHVCYKNRRRKKDRFQSRPFMFHSGPKNSRELLTTSSQFSGTSVFMFRSSIVLGSSSQSWTAARERRFSLHGLSVWISLEGLHFYMLQCSEFGSEEKSNNILQVYLSGSFLACVYVWWWNCVARCFEKASWTQQSGQYHCTYHTMKYSLTFLLQQNNWGRFFSAAEEDSARHQLLIESGVRV